MANIYQFANPNNTFVARTDSASSIPWWSALPSDRIWIPWNTSPSEPLHQDGDVYRVWVADGSPTPAAYVAPPAPPTTLTFLQFMALFTSAEQDAIIDSTDTQVRLFVLMATGAGTITLSDPEVIAGMGYLASPSPGPGLITAARAAQILANIAP